METPARKTGAGRHFLLQGSLPDPGIKPTSLASLPGRFFIPLARHLRSPEPGHAPGSCNSQSASGHLRGWLAQLLGNDIRGSPWLGPARRRGGSISSCLSKFRYHSPKGQLPKEIPSPPSPEALQHPPPCHQPEEQALRTPWLEAASWGQSVSDGAGTLYYNPGRLSGKQGFQATGSHPPRSSWVGTGQAQGPEALKTSDKAAEPHRMGAPVPTRISETKFWVK